MTDTVGFIGLGNMGGPVAKHIQAAGFPMVVFDLNNKALSPFLAAGAQEGSSPANVAQLSDLIFTALPSPQIVETVALGRNGILEGIREDAVYLDISTGGPDLIRQIHARFREKEAWVLDAPVSAGQPGSPPGIHEVMVGGERHVFDRVKHVLAAFGDQILYTGDIGSASICKLTHQLIGCAVSQAVAEGFSMAVKAGVDVAVVWDAVRRGLVGRMHLLHEQIPQAVFPAQYEPATFTLTLLRKDIGLATELGRKLSVPMPLSNLVEQTIVQAMNRGWGKGSGYTVTFKLQEEAADVSFAATGVDPGQAARYISTHPEESSAVAGAAE